MSAKKGILTVCCTVAVAAASIMAITACSGKNDTESSSSVADVLEPVTEAPTEPPLPTITEFDNEQGMTGLAKLLYAENDHTVGYIKVSNTQIDYPVVQYKEDNEYYLHKGFDREYNFAGVIYMDYRDVFNADESKNSENIVLYGHNMLNGSMFAELHKYREDSSFYEENKIIEFSSNYEDYKWVVIGYCLTSGSKGDSYYGENFDYWNMQELDTKEAFDDYVNTIRERSLRFCDFESDIDVQYGDQLLTLQTCHLDSDNSRLLVVARRLRDHETVDSIDTIEGGIDPTEATEGADE